MGRENIDNWRVQRCAKVCTQCAKEFADKENLFSKLIFDEGEYVRHDLCKQCWDKKDPGLSSWKTTFIVPPPPQEEAVKKENAESLLRKLMAKENEEDLNAIFILTVMLERKKILVERDTQTTEDGRKLRIYEHKKTNETFMVIDPELKLDELEEVQEQVVVLLGGQPRNAPEPAPAEDGGSGSTPTAAEEESAADGGSGSAPTTAGGETPVADELPLETDQPNPTDRSDSPNTSDGEQEESGEKEQA
ncbi:hypothetical protein PDESU_03475 [Pontiella desulfatans]|uniref:Uncharacterized protein n=1 Tax=Pontiella desulfatans TaxID=2750659 RepID=A0A6C2U4S9_PONDE|nr:hypothetical protein [Pontiella desulfatans]VGO14905.1 hypothetical protein PDESU_03475 [Pontiella desulfatans]